MATELKLVRVTMKSKSKWKFSEKRVSNRIVFQAVEEEFLSWATFCVDQSEAHLFWFIKIHPHTVLAHCCPALHLSKLSFYAILREQKESESLVHWREGIMHNFPALVSLYVDTAIQCTYLGSSLWVGEWPAHRTSPWFHGHYRGAFWVVLLDLLLWLHSSLHKFSPCKARHRVQICFLQMKKIIGTPSFMACSRSSKLSEAFFESTSISFLLTRGHKWFTQASCSQTFIPWIFTENGEG